MNIIEYLSVNNDCYKSNVNKADSRYTNFQKNGPSGLMLHSVGCPQPSALVFAKSWNRAGKRVAVHGVLQADGTVYQCLPWNFRGWHAGGDANNTHIGVEMTEPDCIKYTGGASFTCSNLAKAKAQVEGTYKTAVELFAYLCKEYGLDPLTDIISHKEGHSKGVASNHGDPEHLWKQLNMGYTMDTFRKAVKEAMSGDKVEEETTPGKSETVLYRVQVGAYKVKENAAAQLKKVMSAGFPTYMVKVDDLYKIQVGAFGVKANAETMLAKVKAAGFDAFITTKAGTAVTEETIKSALEIAKEVVAGKWGNGADRKAKLIEAGYDYEAIQDKVNELLK